MPTFTETLIVIFGTITAISVLCIVLGALCDFLESLGFPEWVAKIFGLEDALNESLGADE